MISKSTIRELARCVYLASHENVPAPKSREASRNSIFSNLIYKGDTSMAPLEAIKWYDRARPDTISRMAEAVSVLNGRIDRMDAPFDTQGFHRIGDVQLKYDVPIYGTYTNSFGKRIGPGIIHVSYRDEPNQIWENEDSWQYNSALYSMVWDVLCCSIHDSELVWESLKAKQMGRVPVKNTGLRDGISSIHLAVDAGPVAPPLIKPIIITPTKGTLLQSLSDFRAAYFETKKLGQNMDQFYADIAALVNAGRSKCRGKSPCPLLSTCHYGRYDTEQTLNIQ